MKEVNIISISHAYRHIELNLLKEYLDFFDVTIKTDELQDFYKFSAFLNENAKFFYEYNNFFLGYKIPQISKEFDLLRFGENYIINVEIKRNSSTEKIKKQLIQNKYYLSFLGTKIICFTFLSDTNTLFRLDNNNDLLNESSQDLRNVLINQSFKSIENIDSVFNPSNYLVSPFNSTNEFVAGNYFLTNHQEEIKAECLEVINNPNFSFISISGNAGTGKTLLTYDIAKEHMSSDKRTLVVHCGLLNNGQFKLRDEYDWELIPAKNINDKELSQYSLIVIDEVQRIYPNQLFSIIRQVKDHKLNCIFSYDKQQTLQRGEINNNIEEHIKLRAEPLYFHLTEKIRTNKEIASFIKCILDRTRQIDSVQKPNVKLNYFKNYKSAKNHIISLQRDDWKVINFTPSNKHDHPYMQFSIANEINAHNVIGQEFDKVIAVVDSYFCYDSDGKLSTKKYESRPYYHPTKMLFQIMTRTRRKLNFIVIDNPELLKRCLHILK
ncbi:DUF2075 domain-containing protein [Cryomorphaceae bacterium 1068]|nr:DUF2075 domain-containing protein [Cryomorphaceae bacterium 1068]